MSHSATCRTNILVNHNNRLILGYLDDANKYGEGFKLLHKGIKNLSKAEKPNETGYHK